MTRTVPRRRITLHRSQMGFTLALTFNAYLRSPLVVSLDFPNFLDFMDS
jgi:hypothetical protein